MAERTGRDEDFTAFVVARSGQLVRFARILCGDRRLAEDLVQSALEKAYPRWNRIELSDPFGYVRQAVVNQHLSWLRRRFWREYPAGDSGQLDPVATSYVDDPAPVALRRVAVEAALGTLTKRERAVVVLRYVEDVSEADTALMLGVAVGTVKSTSARALSKLRCSPELTEVCVGG